MVGRRIHAKPSAGVVPAGSIVLRVRTRLSLKCCSVLSCHTVTADAARVIHCYAYGLLLTCMKD